MSSGFVEKSLTLRVLNRIRFVPPIALSALLLMVSLPARADPTGEPKIQPALLAEMNAFPTERIPIIVEMNAGGAPFSSSLNQALAQQAVSAITNVGGQAIGALSIVDAAAGYATPAQITAISALPNVATVEQDAVVRARRPSSSGTGYPPGSLTSLYPQEVNAPTVWQQGGSGRGVTVAVLDSGVNPDIDLGSGARILAHVGFAGPYNAQQPDLGGHGTHIAGTIGGDGTKSAGQYIGIAPKVNIVDVQVLDAKGNGRMSSILRGMEWVLAHQAQFHIQAMNLSFGATASGPYYYDPLAAAAEIAWRHGIVVVAAAGNLGPQSGTVETPGTDPYIITVGGTDDVGTLQLTDDVLAWFSSWGTPPGSTPKPDLIAPARRVVSIDVPGSTLDQLLPDHRVIASNGSVYLRLTGTSMATGVVSGAVALLLEHQPTLTPDQVKTIVRTATQPYGQNPPPTGAGAGLLDSLGSWNSTTRGSSDTGLRHADAVARTLYPLVYNQPLVWKNTTYLGTNWTGFTWLNLPWADPTWDNIAWDNIAWDNIAWDNIAWDQTGWDNIAWDNIAWDSSEWNNIAWDSFSYD